MLSVRGDRGLRPDPPSPTGVNLLLLMTPSVEKVIQLSKSFTFTGWRFKKRQGHHLWHFKEGQSEDHIPDSQTKSQSLILSRKLYLSRGER